MQKVRPLLSDNVVFKADGVVYHKDLEGMKTLEEVSASVITVTMLSTDCLDHHVRHAKDSLS